MHWTIDNYAVGRKGCYRIVARRGSGFNLQLLKQGEGYWDDVLQNVKFARGRCVEAEAYDESPKGWEAVSA